MRPDDRTNDFFANITRHKRPAMYAGAAIAALVLIIFCLVPSPRTAQAQVPDSGLQRQQMIDELRASNRKLEEIAALLRDIRDGKAGDEKKPASGAKPASNAKPSPTVKQPPTGKSKP